MVGAVDEDNLHVDGGGVHLHRDQPATHGGRLHPTGDPLRQLLSSLVRGAAGATRKTLLLGTNYYIA